MRQRVVGAGAGLAHYDAVLEGILRREFRPTPSWEMSQSTPSTMRMSRSAPLPRAVSAAW